MHKLSVVSFAKTCTETQLFNYSLHIGSQFQFQNKYVFKILLSYLLWKHISAHDNLTILHTYMHHTTRRCVGHCFHDPHSKVNVTVHGQRLDMVFACPGHNFWSAQDNLTILHTYMHHHSARSTVKYDLWYLHNFWSAHDTSYTHAPALDGVSHTAFITLKPRSQFTIKCQICLSGP
jgi:hypothetical protein